VANERFKYLREKVSSEKEKVREGGPGGGREVISISLGTGEPLNQAQGVSRLKEKGSISKTIFREKGRILGGLMRVRESVL